VLIAASLVLLNMGDNCCPTVRSGDQWYLVLTSLPVWWVVLGTVLVLFAGLLLARALSSGTRDRISIGGAAVLALVLAVPGTFLASMIITVTNVRLDSSPPTLVPVTVLDVVGHEHTRNGQHAGTNWDVLVPGWGPELTSPVRITVSSAQAQHLQKGDLLILRTHPGLLGGTWVEAGSLWPVDRR
jgi:hypothetical protein